MSDVIDARTATQGIITTVEARAKDPRWVWGLSFGPDFVALDRMTHGIQEKKLLVLISRPSGGKSALVSKWARVVAQELRDKKAGGVVRIATFEMSAEAYQMRMCASMANVPLTRIETGYATPEQLGRFKAAAEELAKLPLEYLEQAGSFAQLEQFIRRDGVCRLWILDHIGLVPGVSTGYNPYQALCQASIRLSALAHAHTTGIVLGHQNRKGTEGADKRPTGESVAGSDQITKDADLILGIYREDMWTKLPDEQMNQPKPGELLVIKNRNGHTGTVYTIYDPTRTEWKEAPGLNKVFTTEEAVPRSEKEQATNGRRPTR